MKPRLFLLSVLLSCSVLTGAAQDDRQFFSSVLGLGLALDVNANGLHFGRYRESQVPDKPAFSSSAVVMARLGRAVDVFNLSVGFGYRGFFDQAPPHDFVHNPSFSDYLLYSRDHSENRDGSEVRPLGGQLVFPAELHANLARLGDEAFFFIGCGIEYGLRVYQPKRYENYFGAHVLKASSLSYQPMVGVAFDMDDSALTISLYYRRYVRNAFNTAEIPIDKFRRNYLGLQIALTIGNY